MEEQSVNQMRDQVFEQANSNWGRMPQHVPMGQGSGTDGHDNNNNRGDPPPNSDYKVIVPPRPGQGSGYSPYQDAKLTNNGTGLNGYTPMRSTNGQQLVPLGYIQAIGELHDYLKSGPRFNSETINYIRDASNRIIHGHLNQHHNEAVELTLFGDKEKGIHGHDPQGKGNCMGSQIPLKDKTIPNLLNTLIGHLTSPDGRKYLKDENGQYKDSDGVYLTRLARHIEKIRKIGNITDPSTTPEEIDKTIEELGARNKNSFWDTAKKDIPLLPTFSSITDSTIKLIASGLGFGGN